MSGIEVSDGNGSWIVDDPFELWRLMWGSMAFAIAMQMSDGACPGCGCRVSPCAYCLHGCWMDASR